jgi:hypothetical protein
VGRRYVLNLEALDDESLRELQRLLRDHEKQMGPRSRHGSSPDGGSGYRLVPTKKHLDSTSRPLYF